MSKNSDNIEERLVPYLEDVLNPAEKQEVAQAIKADPELARELEELKETITDLREAFASGVTPPQESLSPAEVVELASHDGGLDSMPGTSQQKTKLFMSDQALDEYHMLRALSEEMRRTTLPYEEVPTIPPALMSEFQALGQPTDTKVVELTSKISFWKRTTAWIERIDPKPLMATAAAFAMLSLGVHFYTQPADTANPRVAVTGDAEVAFGHTDQKSPAETAPGSGEAGERAAAEEKTAPTQPGPSGVAVFTSGDKELLNEQAEKLLAKKVRYTVTEDRILVAEKEVAQAREVLWGEEAAGAVAMAEKQEETLRPKQAPAESAPESLEEEPEEVNSRPAPVDKVAKAPAPPPPPRASVEEDEAEVARPAPVQNYNFRTSAKRENEKKDVPQARRSKRRAVVGKAANSKKGGRVALESTSGGADDKPLATGQSRSALKRKSGLDKDRSELARPGGMKEPEGESSDGLVVAQKQQEPSLKEIPSYSNESRQQRLRELALGDEEDSDIEEEEERSDKSPDTTAEQESPPARPVRTEITRARVAPTAQAPVRQAPVANVITSDAALRQVKVDGPAEDSAGSVARAQTKGGLAADQDAFRDENGPVSNIQLSTPGRANRSKGAPKPTSVGTTRSQPNAGAAAYSVQSKEPAKASGDSDFRAVAIRRQQTTVARRYNVILSIESKGDIVKVYVRPKSDLSKSELDQLRRDIRRDLGLSPEDSIIFR